MVGAPLLENPKVMRIGYLWKVWSSKPLGSIFTYFLKRKVLWRLGSSSGASSAPLEVRQGGKNVLKVPACAASPSSSIRLLGRQ